MKGTEQVAWWLVVVGAVNWGLVGLGMLLGGDGWNLVNMIFGSVEQVEALVYLAVGVAGVWLLWGQLAGGKKRR